jgi:hypothetical protein
VAATKASGQPDTASDWAEFDAIVLANGHFEHPNHISLAGEATFPGSVRHSIDYTTPDEYAGKSVVVVGALSSGTDLARELSHVATVVHCVSRATKASGKVTHDSWFGSVVQSHTSRGPFPSLPFPPFAFPSLLFRLVWFLFLFLFLFFGWWFDGHSFGLLFGSFICAYVWQGR